MNGVHEPSRKVSSNWQQHQTESAKAVLDLFEVDAHGRIARKINVSRSSLNDETAPECAVNIAQTATREMLRRDTSHTPMIGQLSLFPPIKFYRVRYSMILKQRSIAQRANEARLVPLIQPDKRCDIQMIVMVVTQEYDIDWWKAFEAQAG